MKNILTLKNRHLEFLAIYLNKFAIAGNESRQRSRFIEIMKERLEEIDKERIQMAEKNSKKDKDGKPIKIESEKGSSYDLSKEGLKLFQEEYNTYLNEEYIIDILEGNKEKVRKVKELLLNSTIPVIETDAILYNEICKVFEEVDFNNLKEPEKEEEKPEVKEIKKKENE